MKSGTAEIGDGGRRPRILVFEDEPSLQDTIRYPLESEGSEVVCCGTAADGLKRLRAGQFDLIVLDIGLPDMNGFEVCKMIRKTSDVPVVFLTARADEVDRVVGLEIGGDDYVTKPFSPRELAARIRAILRRVSAVNSVNRVSANPQFAGVATVESNTESGIEIDDTRCAATFAGVDLGLSRTELRLLAVLLAHPGQVFSRAQLMDHAWDEPDASMERTVDSHVKSLRAKLRTGGADPELIRTHRGFGYAFAEKLQ